MDAIKYQDIVDLIAYLDSPAGQEEQQKAWNKVATANYIRAIKEGRIKEHDVMMEDVE